MSYSYSLFVALCLLLFSVALSNQQQQRINGNPFNINIANPQSDPLYKLLNSPEQATTVYVNCSSASRISGTNFGNKIVRFQDNDCAAAARTTGGDGNVVIDGIVARGVIFDSAVVKAASFTIRNSVVAFLDIRCSFESATGSKTDPALPGAGTVIVEQNYFVGSLPQDLRDGYALLFFFPDNLPSSVYVKNNFFLSRHLSMRSHVHFYMDYSAAYVSNPALFVSIYNVSGNRFEVANHSAISIGRETQNHPRVAIRHLLVAGNSIRTWTNACLSSAATDHNNCNDWSTVPGAPPVVLQEVSPSVLRIGTVDAATIEVTRNSVIRITTDEKVVDQDLQSLLAMEQIVLTQRIGGALVPEPPALFCAENVVRWFVTQVALYADIAATKLNAFSDAGADDAPAMIVIFNNTFDVRSTAKHAQVINSGQFSGPGVSTKVLHIKSSSLFSGQMAIGGRVAALHIVGNSLRSEAQNFAPFECIAENYATGRDTFTADGTVLEGSMQFVIFQSGSAVIDAYLDKLQQSPAAGLGRFILARPQNRKLGFIFTNNHMHIVALFDRLNQFGAIRAVSLDPNARFDITPVSSPPTTTAAAPLFVLRSDYALVISIENSEIVMLGQATQLVPLLFGQKLNFNASAWAALGSQACEVELSISGNKFDSDVTLEDSELLFRPHEKTCEFLRFVGMLLRPMASFLGLHLIGSNTTVAGNTILMRRAPSLSTTVVGAWFQEVGVQVVGRDITMIGNNFTVVVGASPPAVNGATQFAIFGPHSPTAQRLVGGDNGFHSFVMRGNRLQLVAAAAAGMLLVHGAIVGRSNKQGAAADTPVRFVVEDNTVRNQVLPGAHTLFCGAVLKKFRDMWGVDSIPCPAGTPSSAFVLRSSEVLPAPNGGQPLQVEFAVNGNSVEVTMSQTLPLAAGIFNITFSNADVAVRRLDASRNRVTSASPVGFVLQKQFFGGVGLGAVATQPSLPTSVRCVGNTVNVTNAVASPQGGAASSAVEFLKIGAGASLSSSDVFLSENLFVVSRNSAASSPSNGNTVAAAAFVAFSASQQQQQATALSSLALHGNNFLVPNSVPFKLFSASGSSSSSSNSGAGVDLSAVSSVDLSAPCNYFSAASSSSSLSQRQVVGRKLLRQRLLHADVFASLQSATASRLNVDGCAFTATRSFSNATSTHEATETIVPPPPFQRPLAAEIGEKLTAASMTLAALAAASAPALSFSVARNQAMLGLFERAKTGDCRGISADYQSVAAADSPTQMAIGSSIGRYYVGAAVGNVVLVSALVATAQGAGTLYLRRLKSSSWSKPYAVFARCHVAMALFVGVSLLMCPSLTMALVVVTVSDVPLTQRIVAVIFALVILAVTVYYTAWALFVRERKEKYKKLPSEQQNNNNNILRRAYAYWLEGAGEWVMPQHKSAAGKRVTLDDHLDFDAANPQIDGFTERAAWFSAAEFGVQVGLAVAALIANLVPQNVSCVSYAVAQALVLAAYAFLCVYFRPFQELFLRVSTPLLTCSQLIVVVVVAAMASDGLPPWLDSLVVFVCAMHGVMTIVVLAGAVGPLLGKALNVLKRWNARRAGGGRDGRGCGDDSKNRSFPATLSQLLEDEEDMVVLRRGGGGGGGQQHRDRSGNNSGRAHSSSSSRSSRPQQHQQSRDSSRHRRVDNTGGDENHHLRRDSRRPPLPSPLQRRDEHRRSQPLSPRPASSSSSRGRSDSRGDAAARRDERCRPSADTRRFVGSREQRHRGPPFHDI